MQMITFRMAQHSVGMQGFSSNIALALISLVDTAFAGINSHAGYASFFFFLKQSDNSCCISTI